MAGPPPNEPDCPPPRQQLSGIAGRRAEISLTELGLVLLTGIPQHLLYDQTAD